MAYIFNIDSLEESEYKLTAVKLDLNTFFIPNIEQRTELLKHVYGTLSDDSRELQSVVDKMLSKSRLFTSVADIEACRELDKHQSDSGILIFVNHPEVHKIHMTIAEELDAESSS